MSCPSTLTGLVSNIFLLRFFDSKISSQSPIEVSGVVPLPNHYMLLVHYFNPSTQVDLKALLTSNDHFYESQLMNFAVFEDGYSEVG